MNLPPSVTERAFTRLAEIGAAQSGKSLRVAVEGGGCSGFQYGFSFEEMVTEDDTTVSQDGIMVLVDCLSYQYLVGSRVDYEEGLMGCKFVITNPNATTTCGCGSSFAI